MPFLLNLYRAADDLGPMHTWECEHRQALGHREELKVALEQILEGLRWRESDGACFASGPFNGEDHAFEIWLFGEPTDVLLDIAVYASPPAIRAIMAGLDLNYCYASESGELYRPFEAGDRWPGAPSTSA